MTLLIDSPTNNNGLRAEEINLSSPKRRREYLETLMCQKAARGEDITQFANALNYLYCLTREQQLAKEKSVFAAVQLVLVTSFAILGLIAFLSGALRSHSVGVSSLPPIHRQ